MPYFCTPSIPRGTLLHLADVLFWGDIWSGQDTAGVHSSFSSRRNHLRIIVCDMVHRSVCYPSRTTGLCCNRICTWTRWSPSRGSCTWQHLLPRCQLHIYRRPAPLPWILAPLAELANSPSTLRSKDSYKYGTGSKHTWRLQTWLCRCSMDRQGSVVEGLCQALHALPFQQPSSPSTISYL